uniref:Nucleotid_trans domain-containing protein n=1 Tax=Rhabditophanes sp. KR3021 TaxID=114890 RepID=A0AC35UHN9_9BILA
MSLRFVLISILLIFLSYDIHRRATIVYDASSFIQNAKQLLTLESFDRQHGLKEIIKEVNDPAVIMLNKYAINITLNFLCNVEKLKKVHERLLVIVFDDLSKEIIATSFPHIRVYKFNLPALESKFKRGEGTYQLFQYFRAALAAYLIQHTKEFWMIQCDTIWRQNLFEVLDSKSELKLVGESSVLLDSEADSGLLQNMTAGGYFKVRSNNNSFKLFVHVMQQLENKLVTDNNMMSQYCYSQKSLCKFIPNSLLSNWRKKIDDKNALPLFLQYDNGESTEHKFTKMAKIGALFVNLSTYETKVVQCLKGSNENLMESINTDFIASESKYQSNSNYWDRFLCFLVDSILSYFPFTEKIIRSYIYPEFSFILTV